MSDEQANQQPDTRDPSPERQAELEAAYEHQKDSDAPYQGVEIRTLGELRWILRERNWSGKYPLPDGMKRPNLSRARLVSAVLPEADLWDANLSEADLVFADLHNATLRGANLREANLGSANLAGADLQGGNLQGASLMSTNLHRADLSGANLTGATCDGADLTDAFLLHANLTGTQLGHANLSNAGLYDADLTDALLGSTNLSDADLLEVNLSGAHLLFANLSGATLANADLSGANFYQADLRRATLERALLSERTVLDEAQIDAATTVLGVRWNHAALDNVAWATVFAMGEPDGKALTKTKDHQERAVLYQNAARAYHGLIVALHEQGLNEPASKYRLRELAMRRKALRYERNWGGWLLNVLLGVVAGHGEKPGRAFVAYLGIVASFAAIFWAATNFIHTPGQPALHWYEAIVLSLSSFHGRGFFTNTINLGDPLAIVGAAEAVMGLFIELIFIATFSRRFLGD